MRSKKKNSRNATEDDERDKVAQTREGIFRADPVPRFLRGNRHLFFGQWNGQSGGKSRGNTMDLTKKEGEYAKIFAKG